MRIKAIFPEQRVRPVDGIPLDEFKSLAAQARRVEYHNGVDLLASVSPQDLRRRLAAMPEGCEVAVMGGPNKSLRKRPVPTSAAVDGDCLIIATHYSY